MPRQSKGLLELAHEHVRRQARVAQLLCVDEVNRRGCTVPARRLERERRQDRPRCRADGVVLGVFALLRALCAGEDVVVGIVFLWARLWPRGSTVDELLVGDPIGLVDVRSRSQLRAAGLSMAVMPERRISASLGARAPSARDRVASATQQRPATAPDARIVVLGEAAPRACKSGSSSSALSCSVPDKRGQEQLVDGGAVVLAGWLRAACQSAARLAARRKSAVET